MISIKLHFAISLMTLLILAKPFTLKAQDDGFEPPEDFRTDVPASEITEGHTVWLLKNYPQCMIDGQLDSSCATLSKVKKIEIPFKSRMKDISWVKHFKNLETLIVRSNFISILPDSFPSGLSYIDLTYNNIGLTNATDFGVLPADLRYLSISNQRSDLTVLPVLPDSLETLYAHYNKLTVLPDSLPENLKKLVLTYNSISTLNAGVLNSNLEELHISSNKLTDASNLPISLKRLYMNGNQLTSFNGDDLPNLQYLTLARNELSSFTGFIPNLISLDISENSLSDLPALSDSIQSLYIDNNSLSSISKFPLKLRTFSAADNDLTVLPAISGSIYTVNINNNSISAIPAISSNLIYLYAENNQLSSIPVLPSTVQILHVKDNALIGALINLPSDLVELDCSGNNLDSIALSSNLSVLKFTGNNVSSFPYSNIPGSLYQLYADSNQLSSIPNLPEGMSFLKIAGNSIDCIPNLPESLIQCDIRVVCNMNCWKPITGNWSQASNWSEGRVPTNADDVLVMGGFVTVDSEVLAKDIDARGSFFSGEGTITLHGDMKNLGSTFYCNTKFSGTTTQSITASSSYVEELGAFTARLADIRKLIVDNPQSVVLNGWPYLSTVSVLKGYLDLNNLMQTYTNDITDQLDTNYLAIDKVAYCYSANAIRNGTLSYRDNLYSGWSFIGTMMKSQKLNDLNQTVQLGFGGGMQSIFSYDGTKSANNGWTSPTGLGNSFPVGKGYRVYNFTTTSIGFEGLPFTGQHDFGVTYNTSGYDGGGWNLVANPYLSTIDWDTDAGWTKTNMDDAVYIWNPNINKYASYVDGDGQNEGTSLIAPGQAFFVKANNANPDLIIKEEAKSSESTSLFRVAETPKLRISLLDEAGIADEILVKVKDGSTFLFDSEFDALKMQGFGHNISIVGDDSQPLSISSVPQALGTFPINVSVTELGTYNFSFTGVTSMEAGTSAYLIDEQQGEKILLSDGQNHKVEINQYTENSRFYLSFESVLTNTSLAGNQMISVYPNPTSDKVFVRLNQEENVNIHLIDPLGVEVLSLKDININMIHVPIDTTPGLYTLKVQVQNKTHVYKIVKL